MPFTASVGGGLPRVAGDAVHGISTTRRASGTKGRSITSKMILWFHRSVDGRQQQRRCDVDQTTISRLENGRLVHFNVVRLASLIAALRGRFDIGEFD
jgi:hypothetical protein